MGSNPRHDGPSGTYSDGVEREHALMLREQHQNLPSLYHHQPPPPPEDAVDMASLWSTLKEHWKFVCGTGVSVMAVVLAITCVQRMQFMSTSRLYLGDLDKGKSSGSGDVDVLDSSAGDIASEIEIIKSRSIVLEAVINAGHNAMLIPTGWSPPRFWQWLLSGRDSSLLEGAARELSVTKASLPEGSEGEGFGIHFVSDREFEVLVEGEVLAKGTLDAPVQTELGSFTLRAGSHGTPEPDSTYELMLFSAQDAVDAALAALTVDAPKVAVGSTETVKVVKLEYLDRSPQRASDFLRALMEAYLRERQSWKTADATAAESFVANQLKGMRETLDETQKKLAEYRSSTSGVALQGEAQMLVGQIGKHEEQRVQERLQVAALNEIKRALKGPNPPIEAYMFGETGDSVLQGLGKSLAESQQKLNELQTRFNDAAPDVVTQRAQIAAQLDSIRSYVNGRLVRAQENLGTLGGVIGQYEQKLRAAPGAEIGLAQLARESEVYSKLYSYLLERQQQAAIVKASNVSKNRVLDAPEVPRWESSPRLGLRLASGVIGILIGVALVFLRRFFATTLQTENDVRSAAGALPVLASVPRLPAQSGGRGGATDTSPVFERLVSDASSPYAEAFRTLRASLYQAGRARAGQVLLVTSPAPGDGKTTSTLSLAAMLAADEKWVLVIDADLRKPSHHLLTGQRDQDGLRDILSGQCNWRDVVRPVSGPFGEFFSITAGKMAPSELISSARMTRFLVEARSRYDYILIDSPSFPQVADALVLAPLADGVLTVVRLGHTSRALTIAHAKRLSAVAHGHAVLVNGAPVARRHGLAVSNPAFSR